jgi:hypothetical protein
VAADKRDSNLKVLSSRIGLHPMVRAYTDILALEPKEISCKIQIDFRRNPMFLQSHQIQDIITKHIWDCIYLVCKRVCANEHTNADIVAFKEKHQLRLPAAFHLKRNLHAFCM